jgi:WD40 repeat protein
MEPNGSRVAVGGRPTLVGGRLNVAAVEIFESKIGTRLAEYTNGKASQVSALLYTPNGKYMIVGWDDVIQIWDSDHANLLEIRGDVSGVGSSPDGRYLAVPRPIGRSGYGNSDSRRLASTKQERIARLARENPAMAFTSLIFSIHRLPKVNCEGM